MLKRSAALGLVAAFGAVAAFATIAPHEDATPLPPQALIVEPLALQAREVPAPPQYVREEQFQRGDTLAGFLGRLGIEPTLLGSLARTPARSLVLVDFAAASNIAQAFSLPVTAWAGNTHAERTMILVTTRSQESKDKKPLRRKSARLQPCADVQT